MMDELLKMCGVSDVQDIEYHLPLNTRLFHVCNIKYPINQFNSSGYGDRRFDPIEIAPDKYIGSYYAATHYIDAFAETFLRKTHGNTREFSDITECDLLQSDIKRDLCFLDMEKVLTPKIKDALHKSKFDKSSIDPNESIYPILTGFARAFLHYDCDFHFAGLTWEGYQRGVNGHRCFVLFDDRSGTNDLELRVRENFYSDSGYNKLSDSFFNLADTLPIPKKSELKKAGEKFRAGLANASKKAGSK
ncbi:hypothetical protein [Vibrio harveyi]|uniref:hypothetical protein n=1 Tax=Vibrio harveyi TaxID=669 RepID=UPI003CEBDB7E